MRWGFFFFLTDDQKKYKKKYPLEYAIWDILYLVFWAQISLAIAMAVWIQHLKKKSDDVFDVKSREHATISHYLISVPEIIMEDLIETLKQRQNTPWTTGFLG